MSKKQIGRGENYGVKRRGDIPEAKYTCHKCKNQFTARHDSVCAKSKICSRCLRMEQENERVTD